jgi:hypothetical protein
MASFFNIQPDRIKRLDDYLSGIEATVKGHTIADMFKVATSTFKQINAIYEKAFDAPEIRISNDTRPAAQGMEGYIEVSEGLIEHCLSCEYPTVDEVLDGIPRGLCGISLVAQVSLTWVIAHEYFHSIRSHNRVLEECGSDQVTLQAIERDADLCAVAIIYRMYQHFFSRYITDIQLRTFVLYSIFWIIRTLPKTEADLTHPSPDARLWFIVQKLAVLTELHGADNIPDIECKLPQTQGRQRTLIECLITLELAFQSIHGPSSLHGNLIRSLQEIVLEPAGLEPVAKWDKIRTDVSRISATRA